MEKARIKQIANKLEKSLSNWDIKKAIKYSDDETKTRDYLVEPFIQILGYNQMDDYSHEYSLKYAKGSVKKVDMVIFLSKKEPDILIECKKANLNLSERHFKQLNSYYEFHSQSKIGILTNGIQYQFYCRSLDNSKVLNDSPFMTFDVNDYNYSDIENLVKFYRQEIKIQEILEEAEEIYFLEKFEEGLFKTLYKPSDDFVKLVFNNMGGKRITKRVSDKIFALINSISISDAVEKIRISESKDSQSGIFTSAEELRAFNIVKTIIAMSSKVKNDQLDRISFRDYKGFFSVLVDNSQRKHICYFKLSSTKKIIIIGEDEHEIQSVSVKEITKFKRQLVESAVGELN
tara:strand:- start:206 stop:1243 length:1038 start_codon:yes stop_codon:yes gene_type:complete